MNMTITLISCCLEKGNLSYPLGALCIQAAVQQAFNEDQLDCNHSPFLLEDGPKLAAKQIAQQKQDIVGLSVYLWNRDWFDTFAATLLSLKPSLILFAGGPEVTANPASFDLSQYAFLIRGEGEESVVAALQMYLAKLPIEGPGIIGKTAKWTVSKSPNLETIPSPILSTLADSYLKENASVLWEMTRGCPFHCSFCFESRGQRSVRHFPIDRLEAELQYLVNKAVGEIYVLDPTFNMDKKRTLQLLNLILRLAPSIHFVFEIRAELLDEELADAFARLNCSLQIGLQSSDPEVLKTANRRFDATLFARNITLLNTRGIPFGLDLIIGLPKDNLATFRRSLDYALMLKSSNLDIFPLSLLPGTLVAEQASEYGIKSLGKAPYTILSSPTFSEEDLKKAMRLKESCDVFYTLGQAGMWMGKLCEAADLSPSTILELFGSYKDYYHARTKLSPEEDDIFSLQEAFVTSLLKKLGRHAYLPAILSFIELHQGIAFFHTYQESPVLHLRYNLDQLAQLETMSLEKFIARYPHTTQQAWGIYALEDGQLQFLPLEEEN